MSPFTLYFLGALHDLLYNICFKCFLYQFEHFYLFFKMFVEKMVLLKDADIPQMPFPLPRSSKLRMVCSG